ncbi:MAG: pentapeptide repeat-containing protein [Planktothrix sp.]
MIGDGQLPERKFIATEPLFLAGEQAESQVWTGICQSFIQRDCIAYWRYPIFSKLGRFRKEPDILIVDAEWGLIIIEVKSITIEQILGIKGHLWELQEFYTTELNPYQQAEYQLYALLEYCHLEKILRQQVAGRVLVALPRILESQWQYRGFDLLPSCPPILFQDDLITESGERLGLIERIKTAPLVTKGRVLSPEQWQVLKAVISGTPLLRTPTRRFFLSPKDYLEPSLTRSAVLETVRQRISELDLQQEQIAKVIPPGPQRIRGVAGSGKTILLCQKAVQMHLKYPEWDIALVFFSRSLYEPILQKVDQYLRRFSCNQISYNPENSKLKVLHAWGAKDQQGFYRTICQSAGIWSQSLQQTTRLKANESFAEACLHLLRSATIPTIFDAVLIDEGQDFMVDDDLKFEGKQPFYWMAYQSLRPVEVAEGNSAEIPQKRLIWAYDEIQSLESLKIPTASELFGDELGQLVTGEYGNGIQKTEIMSRSYRVPGEILTAAHGLGLGLLRPQGLLTGSVWKEDWEMIGYEVNLSTLKTKKKSLFNVSIKTGETITLKRSAENSLNPMAGLWKQPLIEFEAYHSRSAELIDLCDRLIYNLKIDGLRPSREILIIVLGVGGEAIQLQTYIANFLIQQGIDIFIPGTADCNILKPSYAHGNQFWCEGAVTISRIYRAKGQEADMVYIVGLEQIAIAENNLNFRNQLFVAMTRSRCWLRLTGLGSYPLYEEISQVIKSGNILTFPLIFSPQRDISISTRGELMRRYKNGDRNFQGVNLSGLDLTGVNLSYANLIGANFQNANLTQANLKQAKLVVANLSQTEMTGANLQRVKLVSANLQQTQLNACDLRRADLSYADLSQAQLIGANLKDANLSGANLAGADLSRANLQGTVLPCTEASLNGEVLPDGLIFEASPE